MPLAAGNEDGGVADGAVVNSKQGEMGAQEWQDDLFLRYEIDP